MDMQSFYFFAHLAGKLAFAVSEILHTKINTKKRFLVFRNLSDTAGSGT